MVEGRGMAIDIDVAKRLGDRTIAARFTAGPGLTALFGPSGAGKTSILNMVAGLLKPDRGHIRIGERTLFDGATNLPPEARRVGYVFQDGRLFPHRRVRANLTYGLDLARETNRWMGFDEATQFLGIGHLLGRWPHSLSGGEAQRVAIGRALLAGPEILLMDEPLSSLDAARRGDIMTVIERIRDELRLPVLYVSHDRAEVDRLATSVVEIGE
jgi:molybdate transport system ATP-binding protein